MSATLCSCSQTGIRDWVFPGLNPSLCSQQSLSDCWQCSHEGDQRLFDLYNCVPCKYCKFWSPLPTKGFLWPTCSATEIKTETSSCDWPNKWHSGQPMARRYWGPRGMSDRGCDTSGTEADALLTPVTGRDANDVLPQALRRYREKH